MARFPHYKHVELEVMRRFLATGRIVGWWFFDVPLHTPDSLRCLRHPDPLVRAQYKLLVKRADAVCVQETMSWLFEVKERLRPSGIGELAMYHDLFLEQYRVPMPLNLGYVYTLEDLALHPVAARRNIMLIPV